MYWKSDQSWDISPCFTCLFWHKKILFSASCYKSRSTLKSFQSVECKAFVVVTLHIEFILCRRWEQRTGRHFRSTTGSFLSSPTVRRLQNMARVSTASTQPCTNSTHSHRPSSPSRTSSHTGDKTSLYTGRSHSSFHMFSNNILIFAVLIYVN